MGECPERFFTVCGLYRVTLEGSKHRFEEDRIDRLVIDHQHDRPFCVGGHWLRVGEVDRALAPNLGQGECLVRLPQDPVPVATLSRGDAADADGELPQKALVERVLDPVGSHAGIGAAGIRQEDREPVSEVSDGQVRFAYLGRDYPRHLLECPIPPHRAMLVVIAVEPVYIDQGEGEGNHMSAEAQQLTRKQLEKKTVVVKAREAVREGCLDLPLIISPQIGVGKILSVRFHVMFLSVGVPNSLAGSGAARLSRRHYLTAS